MSNLFIIPGEHTNIDSLLNKPITGLIIGVQDLSIYPLELTIDKIINLADKTTKKIYISLNKMIQNKDLKLVEDTLNKIKNTKIEGIIFYDLGVLNIAKRVDLNKELILNIEHQNTSILSNTFYQKKGINSTIISNDLTIEEILSIKNNTNINIYYTIYGYLPIFYSRRNLLSNYFQYINKEKETNKYHIKNNNNNYMIIEKEDRTIIYSPIINLTTKEEIKKIDNHIIDLSYIDNPDIIDKYLNNQKEENPYLGFYNQKTIYKLKGDQEWKK